MNASDIQAVRDTLQAFQDGYDRRDKTLLPDFRKLFVPEDELEVIGTGAIEPGDDEWCLGLGRDLRAGSERLGRLGRPGAGRG
jgi:hypothetical protein